MENKTSSSDRTYFASRKGKELGEALIERKRNYERFVEQAGLTRVWRKMHWRYYGAEPESGHSDQQVGRDGPEGEIHLLMMNHLRADVTLWLNLALSQRSEMEPEATTDDYEAEIEVKRAKAVLEHFNQAADVETKERLCVEYSGIYGMSYVMRWWNKHKGDVVLPPAPGEPGADGIEPPPGAPVRAGDLEVHAFTPMDVFIDPLQRAGAAPWVICRAYQNRYDKMAEYPALAEQIRDVSSEDDARDNITQRVDLLGVARVGEGKQHRDEIPVFYFFHEPSPALPQGRCVVFLTPEIILEDFPLTSVYERMPVRRIACAEIHRTPFGYSPAWGLLAPQEAQSSLSSIALSNARTFGLGIIITPKGADVDNTDLGGGLKLVEYTPGMEKPSALQMPQTPQEVYAFRGALISEMGTLIGVNSVVRGDPEASLKSGSALALVQAQAVQFSSDFQGNIVIWKENHHFDTISICQRNMSEEMEPKIAGNYQAALLKAFSGKDFKKVTKIRVRGINPMAKTLAGRVQIADTLIERFPQALTPGDYFRVLETGSIDYLTRGEAQRRANLDRENELLSAGIGPKPPPQLDPMTGQPIPEPPAAPGTRYVRALITDDHRAHILKHLEVLDNPAIRESQDPLAMKVIDAVLGHVEEHEGLAVQATQTRLTLLELTNQPPLQSALPPPMMPGAPPGPGGPPAGDKPPPGGGGGEGGSPADSMQPTPAGGGKQPRAAQMPVNPSTGQRVEATPGPT
jgi:hypothetical protein